MYIYILSQYRDPIRVKIIDFGSSQLIHPLPGHPSPPPIEGTTRYCAPEVLLCDYVTEKVDVYSCAILFNEMMTCQMPFQNLHFGYEVEEKIIAGVLNIDMCVYVCLI